MANSDASGSKVLEWQDPSILLEGPRNAMINLDVHNYFPGWDLNWVPPKYKFVVMPFDITIQWKFHAEQGYLNFW